MANLEKDNESYKGMVGLVVKEGAWRSIVVIIFKNIFYLKNIFEINILK
jgi:hypothetical protein